MTNYPHIIQAKFEEIFEQTPLLVRSPGRVNLIGEHTDYNMGFVLPAAINKSIYLGIQKRSDQEIHLYSADYSDRYQTSLNNIRPSGKLWPDYILGVVQQMQQAGSHFKGFNLVFGGDIPVGAGLSSSAALECACGFALNELFNLGFPKLDLIKMGQAAENQFVGVNCGIMDQFTSIYGKAGNLLRLDCRSLEHTYIPFRDDHIDIVLFDTRIKHSLASSAYNQRRAQCEKGVALVRAHHPEVSSLRDVSEEMLLQHVKPEDEETYRRCTYVVAEMERLQQACRSLQDNNFHDFGQRMYESHAGLRDLYQVSCPELDHLVNLVKDNTAVLGARMMGAGFGGCTINLVRHDSVPEVIQSVSAAYKTLTGKEVIAYVAQIEDGASVINT